MFKSFSVTHIGHVRDRNEDSLIDNADLGLWAVADGVGGNRFGDFASQVTCQTIERKLRQGVSLKEAISDAHELVLKLGAEKSEVRGMASTAVAVHFKGAQFEICWVGDSRAYLVTMGQLGSIEQLTTDHNQAQCMFEQGEIELEELRTHPAQRILLNAVGGRSHKWKVDTVEASLKENQILLLCSDGLSGELDDAEILSSFELDVDLSTIAQDLLDKALLKGGSDNITVVLITLDSATTHNLASDSGSTVRKFIEPTVSNSDGESSPSYKIIKYTAAGIGSALLLIAIVLWLA